MALLSAPGKTGNLPRALTREHGPALVNQKYKQEYYRKKWVDSCDQGKRTFNHKAGLSLQVSVLFSLTMLDHCEPQLGTPPSDIHICMLNNEWTTGLFLEHCMRRQKTGNSLNARQLEWVK